MKSNNLNAHLSNAVSKIKTDSLNPAKKKDNLDPGLFKDALDSLKGVQTPSSVNAQPGLTFSNHAVERMQSRGINFSPDKLARINDAVGMASKKGAKETLVLTDSAALIVNVKNQKVVTVMDQSSLKENVFTNIDSTVMI